MEERGGEDEKKRKMKERRKGGGRQGKKRERKRKAEKEQEGGANLIILHSFFSPSLVDHCLPTRGQSLVEAYDQWRAWADPKVCCDYSLHVGITWWSESVQKELSVIAEEKGKG